MSAEESHGFIECPECGHKVECIGDDSFQCAVCFAEFNGEMLGLEDD